MEIVVCEDKKSDSDALCSFINKFFTEINCPVKITAYDNGQHLLDGLSEDVKIAFLDIYMPGISGIEVARKIRERDEYMVIIFTTASVDHGLDGISGIAKNENIRFDARLELPEDAGVSDSDLCIVFGNCVENAIEACRGVSSGRFIRINSKITGKILAITVDNSFDGKLKNKGGAFMSRKHDVEGIGISSIKAIAEKYGGAAQFEAKDNLFQASVMLQTNEKERG